MTCTCILLTSYNTHFFSLFLPKYFNTSAKIIIIITLQRSTHRGFDRPHSGLVTC